MPNKSTMRWVKRNTLMFSPYLNFTLKSDTRAGLTNRYGEIAKSG